MVFPWRANDAPTLNAGLSLLALCFSSSTGPVLLRNPIILVFFSLMEEWLDPLPQQPPPPSGLRHGLDDFL